MSSDADTSSPPPLGEALTRKLPSLSLPPHEDALSLELSVLHLVLKRNRRQHFRAQYFRRMDMVRRAVRRCRLAEDLGIAVRAARVMADAMGAEAGRRRGRGREERWGAGRRASAGGEDEIAGRDGEDPTGPVSAVAHRLRSALTADLPSILSRILHAAEALCAELARGYFVPLCSTLLAVSGRIRSLLLRLGRDGTDALRRLAGALDVAHSGSSVVLPKGYDEDDAKDARRRCRGLSFDDLMGRYISETAKEHHTAVTKRRRDQVLRRGGSSVGSASSAAGGGGAASSSRASVVSTDVEGDAKQDRGGDIGEAIDTGEEAVQVESGVVPHAADAGGTEGGRKVDVNDEMVELMRRKRLAAASAKEEEVGGKRRKKKKRRKSTNNDEKGVGQVENAERKEEPKPAAATKKPGKKDDKEEVKGRWEASPSAIDDIFGAMNWAADSPAEKKSGKADGETTANDRDRSEDAERKKKRKKLKKDQKMGKKKKKSKRNVVDDIFDGL